MNQPAKQWNKKISVLIAITTLVLAVCATLAAFKAASYGNRMVLAQSQAANQWSYYQAKSIKETAYQLQRDLLALTARDQGLPDELVQQKLAEYDQNIARYQQEKQFIADQAGMLESERSQSQELSTSFSESLMFLQVGILLSSLASINKVLYYWYAGLFSGIGGIWFFLHALYWSI